MTIFKFFLLELVTKLSAWLKEDTTIGTIVFIAAVFLLSLYAKKRIAKRFFTEKYKILKQQYPYPLDTLRDLRGYAKKGKQHFAFRGNLQLDIYEQGMIVSCSGYAQWMPYLPQCFKLEGNEGFDRVLVIKIPGEQQLNKWGQSLQNEWEEKADKLDLQISANIEKQIEAQAAGEKSKARAFDKKVDKSMESWLEAKAQADLAAQDEDADGFGVVIPKDKLDLIKRVVLKQTQN